MKKCMQCGGSTKKMAKGGSIAAGIPYATGAGATDGKNGMMRKGGAVKKMQAGGTTTMSKSQQQTAARKAAIADSTTKYPYTSTSGAQYATRKDLMDGRPTNPAKIKTTASKMKKGGMVKNAKLAALAAPKNKITRADVIVGAKRNAKKK